MGMRWVCSGRIDCIFVDVLVKLNHFCILRLVLDFR